METAELDLAPGAPSIYVLSSNYTLPSLLARGLLLPLAMDAPSEIPSFASWGRKLPVFHGGIPATWCDEVQGAARNAFPIALKCRPDAVRCSSSSRKASFEYLYLGDIEAVIFRSDAERERFYGIEYGNVPQIDVKLLTVEPDVFGRAASGVKIPKFRQSPVAVDSACELRRAEAIAAMVAMVLARGGSTPGWISGIRELVSNARSRATPTTKFGRLVDLVRGTRGRAGNDLESQLLAAIVPLLLQYPVEVGWPADEILQRLNEETLQCVSGNSEAERLLARWVDKCRDVLDGRSGLPALTDPRSTFRSAILLLLLRGTAEMLDDETGSDLEGGVAVSRDVRQWALMLSAIRTGFRALDRRFKCATGGSAPRDLRPLVGRILVHELTAPPRPPFGLLECQLRSDSQNAIWNVEMAGVEPLSIPVVLEPATALLAARLSALDYQVPMSVDELEEGSISFAAASSDIGSFFCVASADAGRTEEQRVAIRIALGGDKLPIPSRLRGRILQIFIELQSNAHFEGRFIFDSVRDRFGLTTEVSLKATSDRALKRILRDLALEAAAVASVFKPNPGG